MKRLLSILVLALISFAAFSQATTITLTQMENGHYRSFNLTAADTLGSADTLNVVVQTRNFDGLNFVIDQRKTAVAADTTVVLTVYESMDGATWQRVQYSNSGAQADLPVYTLAKGSAVQNITPEILEGKLRMRYLKLQYVTPTQASLAKVIYGYLKVYTGK